MRRIRKIFLAGAASLALMLSLGTAQAATCGGAWTGPNGTFCPFTATGGPLTFGGFAINGGTAAIGITVFSPPGVFAAQCTNTAAGFASCGQTSIVIPPGQAVLCVVKGLGTGMYSCTA